MKSTFRYISLCLLFCVLSTMLYAKNDGITVYGTYKVNGGDADGVQIRLLRNGINEGGNSSGNGKFEYELQFNNQYELQFSKVGYITKKVVISTDVPERVLDANNDFPPFKIAIELFPEVKGGDYSIFDEPVAMVIYDKELDDFDFDRAYNAEVEEEIKKVEAKIINTPIAKKEDDSSRLYGELIKKADSEFDAKSYVDARKTYQKAQKVKPAESYPQVRIDLIDRILVDLKKRKEQKSKNDSYYALIDKADVLLEEKEYQPARSYYVEASKIKPDQQYPKDKIKLIDQIFANRDAEQRQYDNTVALADRYFQEKKYQPARTEYEKALKMRKDETYPKEQIKRIERLLAELQSKEEREKNYNTTLAKADALFDKKNWVDARDTYERASDILPKKKYPKERISEIDKLLKSEQKELGQYTAAIKRADSYFEKEIWENAQNFYQKALGIKPNEAYPKEQIKKIEQILSGIADKKANEKAYKSAIAKGDRAFKKEDWEEAKEAYFAALKAQPEETYPKKRISTIEDKLADLAKKKEEEDRYNEKLKQADASYDKKAWNEALAQYKAASEMKPSENYPKAQIKKIERFLKEELERKSAQEKEDNYKALIAKGDQAYDSENWDISLANYEGALQIKPDANYPQNRINAINQRLKDLAKAEDLQKRYDAVIKQADELFENSEWSSAIAQYHKALDLKPKEAYPRTQIDKIKGQISAEELAKVEAQKAAEKARLQKAYDEAIAEADKELSDKRYAFAKQGYRKALSILPDEKYPKDKLREIDALFQKQREAKNRYYKVLDVAGTDSVRYYKRIVPKVQTEKQEYITITDPTQSGGKKYQMLMEKAQKEESAGNIPFAKSYYQQAYRENPSPVLLTKLKELESRMQVRQKQK